MTTKLRTVKSMTEKEVRKELHLFRKQLKVMCVSVQKFLELLDAEMKLPSTFERGQRIAKMCNRLQYVNDSARHFTLNESLKKKRKQMMKWEYQAISNPTPFTSESLEKHFGKDGWELVSFI